MSRWFRFYEGALDDPKVQRLAPDVFKGWVNLLCLAARGKGRLPSLGDIAFALRISDREAESLVTALLAAGLLDDDGQAMTPHKWYERQFDDPTNASRQRKFREKKKAEADVTRYATVTPVTDNGDVTPVYTEQNRTEQKQRTDNTLSGVKARKRAVTIPEGFPSEADIRWTIKEHPKLAAWDEAAKFRDYALQHGRTYLDWPAAWRLWCRNSTKWANEPRRKFA